MVINENIPIFYVTISDDQNSDIEANFIAIVDRPAINKNFLAFSESTFDASKLLNFQIEDSDRRIISGAIMLSDTPLIRVDPVTKEKYYTVFSKETIYKIVQKFHKKGFQSNVNLMHDKNSAVNNVVLFESFISDPSRGIMPMKGFEDAPVGSWFGSMLIEDDLTWEKIKSGELRGFSIEGMFNLSLQKKAANYRDLSPDQRLEKIKELLALLPKG